METDKTVSEIEERVAESQQAKSGAVGVEERKLEINRDYDSQKS